jgi:hypothetical protein
VTRKFLEIAVAAWREGHLISDFTFEANYTVVQKLLPIYMVCHCYMFFT